MKLSVLYNSLLPHCPRCGVTISNRTDLFGRVVPDGKGGVQKYGICISCEKARQRNIRYQEIHMAVTGYDYVLRVNYRNEYIRGYYNLVSRFNTKNPSTGFVTQIIDADLNVRTVRG